MDIALVIVRLIGLGFAAHGAQKLFGWFGGYGLAGTGGFFEGLGWKPGRFFAGAAGVCELLGGLLVFVGLGGPIGPMLIIAVMLTAAIAVHLPSGWFVPNGVEVPVLYMGLAVMFAFVGYGAYSLDAAFAIGSFWTTSYIWIALGLGVLGALGNLALRRKPAPPETAPAA